MQAAATRSFDVALSRLLRGNPAIMRLARPLASLLRQPATSAAACHGRPMSTSSAKAVVDSGASKADAESKEPGSSAVARRPDGTESTLVPGIPDRATAGVSDEYRLAWAKHVERTQAKNLPVNYDNPGASGDISKIPEEVLNALPPPRRPLWPEAPWKGTWRQGRAFIVLLFFVALAVYLQAKARVQGSVRIELERRYGWLTAALVRLNVIRDYTPLLAGLDRDLLFARLFAKYAADPAAFTSALAAALAATSGSVGDASAAAAAGASAAPTASQRAIPLARAAAILSVLRGEEGALPAASAAAAAASAGDAKDSKDGGKAAAAAAVAVAAVPSHVDVLAVSNACAAALQAAGVDFTVRPADADTAAAAVRPGGQPAPASSSSGSTRSAIALAGASAAAGGLTVDQFVRFLRAGTEDLPPVIVMLACADLMDVTASAPPALRALTGLYDRLSAARPGAVAAAGAGAGVLTFTPVALADLAGDIGFSADLERAQRYLSEAAAASAAGSSSSGAAAAGSKPAGAAAGAGPAAAVPLPLPAFVDFMVEAAAASQVDDHRVPDYLRTFYLLHMSGMREAAGVKPLA